MEYTSTPCDDVGHTLLHGCSQLIFLVINEMFGKHYDGMVKIVFQPNALNIQQQKRQVAESHNGLKIVRNLASKSDFVSEGVEKIMGGKILNYPAKRILNKGKAEGRAEGRVEGWDSASLELIKNLMASMNLDMDTAMSTLNIPEDERAQYRAALMAK